MTRILFAVLSTVRRLPAGVLPIGLLLLGALPAGCAGDDRPRPMHIAAQVENEAVMVEVTEIPPSREIVNLVLVDAAGRETLAREREISTREEVRGGNVGPGVGIGASGGSSSGINPFISLGYIFGGDSEVRRSQRMTASIPLADPAAYATSYREWRVELRYRDELGELKRVSVPAPAP
jgi:hypothetical protein